MTDSIATMPASRWPGWLLAALPGVLVGTVLLAAWPGYLSFDSAYQFWQARTGEFGDVAPPLLPALWWLTLRLGLPDSSGPLLLIGLLYAAAFALLVLAAWRRGQPRLAAGLAVLGPLCPQLLVLLPHVWTDVLLAGAALMAVGLLRALDTPRPWAVAAFGLLLLLVAALRHNGVFAAAPLLVWAALHWWPAANWRRRLLLVAAALVALVAMTNGLRSALIAQRLDTWAVTPLFDLQAVSVARGEQRIPAALAGAGLSVEELREAFHPYSATLLFAATRSGVHDPTLAPLAAAQRDALLDAWLALWREPAYWQHRGRLMRALLGDFHGDTRGLADSPALTAYRDNPPLQWTYPALHAGYRSLVERLHGWRLYRTGTLALVAVLAVLLFARRRAQAERDAALALLGCAALYAAPYAVLAPSSELRYLLWPAMACWLALQLVVFGPTARSGGNHS